MIVEREREREREEIDGSFSIPFQLASKEGHLALADLLLKPVARATGRGLGRLLAVVQRTRSHGGTRI